MIRCGLTASADGHKSVGVICRLLGCDVYSFDFKINHIARHIQLPAPPHLGPGAKSLPDAEQIPPLLVLNIQLPMYPVRPPAPSLSNCPESAASILKRQCDISAQCAGGYECCDHQADVACVQASIFGKSDRHGHSLVYNIPLPDGWEPSMMDNKHALALWQRFVHDGSETDG